MVKYRIRDRNVIVKVFMNQVTGQKFITIPKNSTIVEGDYVSVSKIYGVNDGRYLL